MAHINTLEYFDNLIASGIEPQQARAHVNMLDKSFDDLVTKDMLKTELKNLENDLKFFFIKVIGATFVIAFILPLLLKKYGWA